MAQERRSGTAVGFTMFAAFMMIMVGSFHIIAGLAGIIENEFWSVAPAIGTEASGDVYFLQFDATTLGLGTAAAVCAVERAAQHPSR